jgi:hypothetical protein
VGGAYHRQSRQPATPRPAAALSSSAAQQSSSTQQQVSRQQPRPAQQAAAAPAGSQVKPACCRSPAASPCMAADLLCDSARPLAAWLWAVGLSVIMSWRVSHVTLENPSISMDPILRTGENAQHTAQLCVLRAVLICVVFSRPPLTADRSSSSHAGRASASRQVASPPPPAACGHSTITKGHTQPG